MPGVLEAVVSSHLVTMFEAYERLANLDERIAIRWLMPSKPVAVVFGLPGSIKHRVWVRPKNSTNVKILGGSHFVRAILSFSAFLSFLWESVLIQLFFLKKIDSSRNTTSLRYVAIFYPLCLIFINWERYTLADDLNKFILHHFQTTEPLIKAKL